MHEKYIFLLTLSILFLLPISQAEAGSNPNLSVSAENSKFNNHFSGSMVIEVVIRDSSIKDTDEGKGEPDVTLNGKNLRMVQATDGNWYAYFANVNKAKAADSTVPPLGEGEGLDFGVFCGRNTSSLGIDLSDTDGVAIPRDGGMSGFTNGMVSFSSCTGTPTNSENLNNVVRKAKSINTNSNIPTGQIGLVEYAWPLIQLYSFNDVTIQYNPGGGTQQVNLQYDEIPNISLDLDRDIYPQNSEVFVTVSDIQLNQDPTDEDSWTFNIGSPNSVFYQAFDNSGNNAANETPGLVDLRPHLPNLGFEDNGILSVDLEKIMELKTNDEQPDDSVDTDGSSNTYSEIVTLVEEGPYSGIFDNADNSDQSTIGILDDAPRGLSGIIEYNGNPISVLSGFSTASVSFEKPILTIGDGSSSLRAGTETPITLGDNDQNINSDADDDLDLFRDSSLIPTLEIGRPVTLESANNVQFSPETGSSFAVSSSLPDKNSKRLFLDTTSVANGSFEKISLNLGISASALNQILIDNSLSNSFGTNWLNYDLRSMENDFEINDFSDTSIELSFGSLGASAVTIVDAGEMSSNGFIQLDNSDIKEISSKSGSVFVEINFDSSPSPGFEPGTIDNEINKQPIVLDFFSFGLENNNDINNSIYRFELEETSENSSIFAGTLEYAVTNQLNILDSDFIQTIRTIDNEIKFIVTDRLVDEEGISINYSDLDAVGVATTTSAKSDIETSSGIVSLDSVSYRFGQPVTFTLRDSDLNLKSDTIETYLVVNDPNSPNVDAVGKDGAILLEILIKDFRYKRCTIDGIEYGGLGSTGFSLVETGPRTGIFKGVFKMPSEICDKSGTKLISSAGGSVDAKYFDARDKFGESNIVSLSSNNQSSQPVKYSSLPELNQRELILPTKGNLKDVLLSGNVLNHKIGIPLTIILVHPDGLTQKFSASLTNEGDYKAIFSINENSLSGIYGIYLSQNDFDVGFTSFFVFNQSIPDSAKSNARNWSMNIISDSMFANHLEDLIDKGIIKITSPKSSLTSERNIPNWLKTPANWWSNNDISNGDFITAIEYLIKKGIIRI
ncbi:MAG: peptidase [Nitrosopumilus sp.]|nr:peptidase [Nitrosopumilus sp.]